MELLYINRNVNYGPWGGGAKAVNALVERCGQYGFRLARKKSDEPDVVLLMGIDREDQHVGLEDALRFKLNGNPKPRVYMRANNLDACRGTDTIDRRILTGVKHLDGTVFVSDWVEKYFSQRAQQLGMRLDEYNSRIIVNGVDPTIFRPREKEPTTRVRIVTHHWSDNPHKSGTITPQLDAWVAQNSDKFELTFIGRPSKPLPNTRLITPLSGAALGEELAKHDVYVSESKFDAGPNHILEAIATGLPTYVHRDGGGCVDFAGEDHTYGSFEELRDILLDTQSYKMNNLRLRTWDDFARDMFTFMRS